MLSLKRIGLTLGPSLLATVPILFIAAHLDANHAMVETKAGETVTIMLDRPDDITVDHALKFKQGWLLNWPVDSQSIKIYDQSNALIFTVTDGINAGYVGKNDLYTFFFGARAGSLGDESIVDSFSLKTSPQQLLLDRFVMPYQWAVIFFFALIVFSIFMKFRYRIH